MLIGNDFFKNIDTSISMQIQAFTENKKRMPEKCGFLIRKGDDFVLNELPIEFEVKSQKTELDTYLSRGTAHICVVENSFADGHFSFEVKFFAGSIMNLGEIAVLIEAAKLRGKEKREDLSSTINFEINGESYFLIQTSDEEPPKNKNTDADETDEQEKPNKKENFAFAIIGEKTNFCVEKCMINNGVYYSVTKRFKRRNNSPQINYRLVKGSVEMSDKKQIISEYNKKQLEEIMQNSGSYLNAWKKYTEERGAKDLEDAKEFGAIHFNNCEDKGGGKYVLYFEKELNFKDTKKFSDLEIFDNDDEEPYFVTHKECSFEDYIKFASEKTKKDKKSKSEKIQVSVEKFEKNTITVIYEGDKKINLQKGFVCLSIFGEVQQITRQQDAWNMIAEGKSGIPHLGLLFEDKGSENLPMNQTTVKGKKISAHVYEKIFANPPTDNQRLAIEVALQTPDIALIQGPPGTGKTTVITAILELLNEMQDKSGVCAGKILATSYQHDAVNNMIARLSVNSLPTYKFGSRRGEGPYEEHIQKWCDDIYDKVLKSNPELEISQGQLEFYDKWNDYEMSPNMQTQNLLKQAIDNLPFETEFLKKANALFNYTDDKFLNEENFPEIRRQKILSAIRGLRITKESFADDGNDRAMDLYSELREYISEEDANKIKKAATISAENLTDDFIKELAELKQKLIEKFSPKPAYVKVQANVEIINFCKEVEKHLHDQMLNKDKKTLVLSSWLEQLQIGPKAVEKAIKELDFVYAATAQQAAGVDINKMKMSIDESNPTWQLYDTVIIDEAARATPPDLLIPMCKAAKRIILVGDHRQLPQLVDEDLCRRVEQSELKNSENSDTPSEPWEATKEKYELSLFEILFSRLQELEKKDGIKRTVTLNSQFRTHPVLGNFASDHFYKPHGESYVSPRPAEQFSHMLYGIINKAAVWINVPAKQGSEERNGSSYCRPIEAKIIAQKIYDFIISEHGKDFSYGVITFYRGQVDIINDELKKLHVDRNKIKVGTVDAFQGMEFDVVFLSVVRCNEKANFGFLKSKNRQCVAMTRQKKLLIAVGDVEFSTSEEARKESNISAIADFYDLCKTSEYGAIL